MGSIVTSLLPPSAPRKTLHTVSLYLLETSSPLSIFGSHSSRSPFQIRQKHIKIISICNTVSPVFPHCSPLVCRSPLPLQVSRIFIGLIADYLSASREIPSKSTRPLLQDHARDSSLATPIQSSSPLSGLASPARDVPKLPANEPRKWTHRVHLSKISMVLIILVLLVGVYTFAAMKAGLGTKGVDTLWVLTGVVGWSYGCLFTLLPSIVTQIFGLKTFGRNYGLLSYFVAFSSLGFTYLYGVLANKAYTTTGAEKICRGAGCFRQISEPFLVFFVRCVAWGFDSANTDLFVC